MIEDDILREIRETREAFARRFHYDVKAMGDYLREEQEKSGRPVVRLQPRRPAGSVEPESARVELNEA